ncbi:MAG: DUF2723 domain-containing protein [Bacteroidia bacterium]|nr:DUF2723 domain-containing protein [Bacteroidia bacterium]
MIKYKLWNNILGWASFAVGMVVYSLTVEPSVPLWDCGEFISASYSLQVVHPPGAPFFLLLGRLFSLFAMGDLANVAMAVNMLSVVASALTVGFTFWIITHLAVKMLGLNVENPEVSLGNGIAIFGSGLVGALALTFMDTFWFSAVEAEVYASSSFFTALSFWGILKWESNKSKPTSDRWLIFIAYMIGLSIGLHLLNLLVVPAIVLYYFFNRFEVNRANIIKALVVGGGSLVLINWVIIPGLPQVAATIDKLFVNGMGLPFNSGVIFTVALVFALVTIAIRYTARLKQSHLGIKLGGVKLSIQTGLANLFLLCLAYVLIGYSSYSMVVIRSLAEPAIDMNDPEDAYSLLSYIKREQYGSRPLFKGPYYMARPIDYKDGSATYRRGEDKYEHTGYRIDYVWDEKDETIFPRMGDLTDKKQGFKFWYKERKSTDAAGNETIKMPSFNQNIKFMMDYQIGWMYWRYFFWNFGGRQSDIQNVDNNIHEGNWLSGIDFIDKRRIGTQKDVPSSLSSNKARNKYYLIPFLLGIIGLVFQFNRQKRDATVITLLFFMTGLAIVLYLNQPPLEPRERDYASVGSFQTFCIWIGLAVLAITELLKRYVPLNLAATIATVLCLTAPYLMGTQNWDDHDRSDRYLGISFAKNYLNSCEKNAILFTNGDNDTYPLWYAQNVEGIRTDVRIINLSLLSTEYYAQALVRKYYASEPLPMSIIPREKLKEGERDMISYNPQNKYFEQSTSHPLSEILDFVVSDDDRKKARSPYVRDGDLENYLPARKVYIKVDKAKVLASGTVQEKDSAKIVDYMTFGLNTRLLKGSIVMLDIIATNAERGWERPIYFTTTTGDDTYANMESYFRHEGLTYRLVPLKSNWGRDRGLIDKDLLYKRLMEDFVWGNMDKGTMFLDHKATLVPRNLRVLFVQVAQRYLSEGNEERAKALINKSLEVIPESILPMDNYVRTYYIDMLNNVGETEKANAMLAQAAKDVEEQTNYFFAMRKDTRDKRIRQSADNKLIGSGRGDGLDGDIRQLKGLAIRMKDSTSQNAMEQLEKLFPRN